MKILIFFLGLMLGGLLSTVVLCCFQINRTNSYEREISKLKAQLLDSKK